MIRFLIALFSIVQLWQYQLCDAINLGFVMSSLFRDESSKAEIV